VQLLLFYHLIQKKGFSLLDMKFYLERRGYQADGYKIKLDQLIAAALKAGSPGAKLSGGGCGGQMIAIAHPWQVARIEEALNQAGAVRVMTTLLAESGAE